MKARRQSSRLLVVEKFPPALSTSAMSLLVFRPERLKKRFPVRIVDYGDLVVSTTHGHSMGQ